MKIPEWVKPENWSPETRAAARETIRVAVIFAFTLFQAESVISVMLWLNFCYSFVHE